MSNLFILQNCPLVDDIKYFENTKTYMIKVADYKTFKKKDSDQYEKTDLEYITIWCAAGKMQNDLKELLTKDDRGSLHVLISCVGWKKATKKPSNPDYAPQTEMVIDWRDDSHSLSFQTILKSRANHG